MSESCLIKTQVVTLRVPNELKSRLEQQAKFQGVSLNNLANYLLIGIFIKRNIGKVNHALRQSVDREAIGRVAALYRRHASSHRFNRVVSGVQAYPHADQHGRGHQPGHGGDCQRCLQPQPIDHHIQRRQIHKVRNDRPHPEQDRGLQVRNRSAFANDVMGDQRKSGKQRHQACDVIVSGLGQRRQDQHHCGAKCSLQEQIHQ